MKILYSQWRKIPHLQKRGREGVGEWSTEGGISEKRQEKKSPNKSHTVGSWNMIKVDGNAGNIEGVHLKPMLKSNVHLTEGSKSNARQSGTM